MDAQTILPLMFLGGILLICALVIIGLSVQRTVIAMISGLSWYRKIFLEHYIWAEDSSYYGFPEGSRNQAKHTESYQSYEHVGTETNTTTVNGQTTTTSRPVYKYVTRWRTKYTYEIQQWQPSRTIEAHGAERTGVHWPSCALDASTQERVKYREEQYLAIFQTVKGKQYKHKMKEAVWYAFNVEATCILKVNLFGQIKHVEYSPEQCMRPMEYRS